MQLYLVTSPHSGVWMNWTSNKVSRAPIGFILLVIAMEYELMNRSRLSEVTQSPIQNDEDYPKTSADSNPLINIWSLVRMQWHRHCNAWIIATGLTSLYDHAFSFMLISMVCLRHDLLIRHQLYSLGFFTSYRQAFDRYR